METWYAEENARIDEYHGKDVENVELTDSPEPLKKPDPDDAIEPVEGYRTPKKKSMEKVELHTLRNNVTHRGNKVQKKRLLH